MIMWGGIGVINLLEKNEIINRHLIGESKRQIARELGKSRQVISKYIAEYEASQKAVEVAETLAEKEAILIESSRKPRYKVGVREKPAMTPEIEAAF